MHVLAEVLLFGVVHGARLADDRHLDLTGILHRLLDLLGDVARQPARVEVIDLLRADDDAYLASRLDGEALLNHYFRTCANYTSIVLSVLVQGTLRGMV